MKIVCIILLEIQGWGEGVRGSGFGVRGSGFGARGSGFHPSLKLWVGPGGRNKRWTVYQIRIVIYYELS